MASNIKDHAEHGGDPSMATQLRNDTIESCAEVRAKEKEEKDCRNALIDEDLQAPVAPETNYLTPKRSGLDNGPKSSIKSAIGPERVVRTLSTPRLVVEALRSPFRSLRRSRRSVHASISDIFPSISDIFPSQDSSSTPTHPSPLRTNPSHFEPTYSPIPSPPGAPRLSFRVLHKEPGLTTMAPLPGASQKPLSPAPAVDSLIDNSHKEAGLTTMAPLPGASQKPLSSAPAVDSLIGNLHKDAGLTTMAPLPGASQKPLSSAPAVDSLIGNSRTRTTVHDSAASSSVSGPSAPRTPQPYRFSSSSNDSSTTKIDSLPGVQTRALPKALPSNSTPEITEPGSSDEEPIVYGVYEAQVAIRCRARLIDIPPRRGRGRPVQKSSPEPNVKPLASPSQASSAKKDDQA